jgi:hypothetical protein
MTHLCGAGCRLAEGRKVVILPFCHIVCLPSVMPDFSTWIMWFSISFATVNFYALRSAMTFTANGTYTPKSMLARTSLPKWWRIFCKCHIEGLFRSYIYTLTVHPVERFGRSITIAELDVPTESPQNGTGRPLWLPHCKRLR